MSNISFWTPVSFGELSTTRSQRALEAIDHYFYLGGQVARVQNDDGEVVIEQGNPSCLSSALKVASYCSIVIPLVALILKAGLRNSCQFRVQVIHVEDSVIDDELFLSEGEEGEANPLVDENKRNQAAIVCQKHIRGWLERKRLEQQRQEVRAVPIPVMGKEVPGEGLAEEKGSSILEAPQMRPHGKRRRGKMALEGQENRKPCDQIIDRLRTQQVFGKEMQAKWLDFLERHRNSAVEDLKALEEKFRVLHRQNMLTEWFLFYFSEAKSPELEQLIRQDGSSSCIAKLEALHRECRQLKGKEGILAIQQISKRFIDLLQENKLQDFGVVDKLYVSKIFLSIVDLWHSTIKKDEPTSEVADIANALIQFAEFGSRCVTVGLIEKKYEESIFRIVNSHEFFLEGIKQGRSRNKDEEHRLSKQMPQDLADVHQQLSNAAISCIDKQTLLALLPVRIRSFISFIEAFESFDSGFVNYWNQKQGIIVDFSPERVLVSIHLPLFYVSSRVLILTQRPLDTGIEVQVSFGPESNAYYNSFLRAVRAFGEMLPPAGFQRNGVENSFFVDTRYKETLLSYVIYRLITSNLRSPIPLNELDLLIEQFHNKKIKLLHKTEHEKRQEFYEQTQETQAKIFSWVLEEFKKDHQMPHWISKTGLPAQYQKEFVHYVKINSNWREYVEDTVCSALEENQMDLVKVLFPLMMETSPEKLKQAVCEHSASGKSLPRALRLPTEWKKEFGISLNRRERASEEAFQDSGNSDPEVSDSDEEDDWASKFIPEMQQRLGSAPPHLD